MSGEGFAYNIWHFSKYGTMGVDKHIGSLRFHYHCEKLWRKNAR